MKTETQSPIILPSGRAHDTLVTAFLGAMAGGGVVIFIEMFVGGVSKYGHLAGGCLGALGLVWLARRGDKDSGGRAE